MEAASEEPAVIHSLLVLVYDSGLYIVTRTAVGHMSLANLNEIIAHLEKAERIIHSAVILFS